MEDRIKEAKARIATLRQEIEKLELFIGLATDLFGEPLDMSSDPQPDLPGDGSPPPERSKPKQARTTGNPSPKKVVETVKAILQSRHEPMTRSALYAALKEQGVVIRGADPVKALGTTLWRAKDEVVSTPDGYWLAKAPVPNDPFNRILGD